MFFLIRLTHYIAMDAVSTANDPLQIHNDGRPLTDEKGCDETGASSSNLCLMKAKAETSLLFNG